MKSASCVVFRHNDPHKDTGRDLHHARCMLHGRNGFGQGMAADVEVGVTTYDLDQAGKKYMAELGCKSACFNYKVGSQHLSITHLLVGER